MPSPSFPSHSSSQAPALWFLHHILSKGNRIPAQPGPSSISLKCYLPELETRTSRNWLNWVVWGQWQVLWAGNKQPKIPRPNPVSNHFFEAKFSHLEIKDNSGFLACIHWVLHRKWKVLSQNKWQKACYKFVQPTISLPKPQNTASPWLEGKNAPWRSTPSQALTSTLPYIWGLSKSKLVGMACEESMRGGVLPQQTWERSGHKPMYMSKHWSRETSDAKRHNG